MKEKREPTEKERKCGWYGWNIQILEPNPCEAYEKNNGFKGLFT